MNKYAESAPTYAGKGWGNMPFYINHFKPPPAEVHVLGKISFLFVLKPGVQGKKNNFKITFFKNNDPLLLKFEPIPKRGSSLFFIGSQMRCKGKKKPKFKPLLGHGPRGFAQGVGYTPTFRPPGTPAPGGGAPSGAPQGPAHPAPSGPGADPFF